METIMQLVALAKAHAWTTLLLHGALALILLAFARRSQIDTWAESNPKAAGVLKILRGFGIDPWLILSGISLLIRGRLPKDPPSSGGVQKGSDVLPRLTTLGICSAAVLLAHATGCAQVRDVVWPTVTACKPSPAEVMADVYAALKNDPGGPLSVRALRLLEDLARKHGSAAIVCAANDVADRLAANGDPEGARVSDKARAFLAHVETRVEE